MITYQVIGPQLMAEFARMSDAQNLYNRSAEASIVMYHWHYCNDRRVRSTCETIETKALPRVHASRSEPDPKLRP